MAELKSLLLEAVRKDASDLHLVTGLPPALRITQDLGFIDNKPLDSASVRALIDTILTEEQKEKFETEKRLNFGYEIPTLSRFRVNVFMARGGVGVAIRVIPLQVRSVQELGLPPTLPGFLSRPSGIILVTGPTGSGKSTTLAAMVEHINQRGKPSKIITIEDPVEYVYKSARSIIVQREVGVDVPTFDFALVEALRQDPDIIVVGEMRTRESIEMALTAAETGHLVITTLHTADPAQTVDRLVAAFAPHERDVARQQLANTVEVVLCQELLQRSDKKGLCVAVELMIANPAIRHMIRDDKTDQMHDIIQTGIQAGMIPKDHSYKALVQRGLLKREVAASRMRHPELLR